MTAGAAHVDVLISEQELAARVRALGDQITRDHTGRSLVVVGVLKGSFIFLADLVRAIDLPISVDFIGISSYQGASRLPTRRSAVLARMLTTINVKSSPSSGAVLAWSPVLWMRPP